MLSGELFAYLDIEFMSGELELDRHAELPARLDPQLLVGFDEFGLVLCSVPSALERAAVRRQPATGVQDVCVPVETFAVRLVDHPVHRSAVQLGELGGLARNREIGDAALHELKGNPNNIVPTLARVEPLAVGRLDTPRPLEGIAPLRSGPFGQGNPRHGDSEAAAIVVVAGRVHAEQLWPKPPALRFLPLHLHLR